MKKVNQDIMLSVKGYEVKLGRFVKDYKNANLSEEFFGDVVLISEKGSSFVTLVPLLFPDRDATIIFYETAFSYFKLAKEQEASLSAALRGFLLRRFRYLMSNKKHKGLHITEKDILDAFKLLHKDDKEEGRKIILRDKILRDIKEGIPTADGLVNYILNILPFAEKWK